MALASASLSATFHFRAGPASADLEAMNATDLMKGMPSMDVQVGHLNAKKLQLCIKKGSGAARSWTAGLTTSILLPLHSELWSRLPFEKMFELEEKMFHRDGGGDLRYARWDIFKGSSKYMMIHTEVQV